VFDGNIVRDEPNGVSVNWTCTIFIITSDKLRSAEQAVRSQKEEA
jgi:hypothetical protein